MRLLFDQDSSLMLQNYLAQYGYLPPTNPENGAFLSSEKLTAAIEEFQAFAGLNITGTLISFSFRDR